MAHIQENMKELNTIVAELKVINAKAKELRARKKELDVKILEYLETTNTPGLKYHELVVLKSESTTRTRLKKKEKQENMIKVLEDSGVEDAEKIYKAIIEATVGEESTKPKLRVKNVLPEIF